MSARRARPATQDLRRDASPHPLAAPPVAPTRPAIAEVVLRVVTPADLARLPHMNGYPMVSVLLPTTPGARLDPEDRANLADLVERTQRRLAAELPGVPIDELIGPLRRLATQVMDSYRLLTLASGSARLYLGTGAQRHEPATGGFPVGERTTSSAADRSALLRQGEAIRCGTHLWDRFVCQVDDALDAGQRIRDLSLIVAAAEPLALRHRRRSSLQIVGTNPGGHQRTPTVRLAYLARPVIAFHLGRLRQEALDGLERAVDQRRAASGINQVWHAATAGRIALLLVDPAYTYPALAGPDGRSLTRSSDPEHPDFLDDAVDEIIELVARRGGRVCFAALDGAGDQIAAVLEVAGLEIVDVAGRVECWEHRGGAVPVGEAPLAAHHASPGVGADVVATQDVVGRGLRAAGRGWAGIIPARCASHPTPRPG